MKLKEEVSMFINNIQQDVDDDVHYEDSLVDFDRCVDIIREYNKTDKTYCLFELYDEVLDDLLVIFREI